jgi:cytochrome c2
MVVGMGLLVGIGILTGRWASRPSSAPNCHLSEDAMRGRVWAPTCKGCHDITNTQQTDLKHWSGGPNLQNVYMSLAGTQQAVKNPTAAYQYPYPPLAAARDIGVVWTDDNLFLYLRDPKGFLDRTTGKTFGAPIFYMNFNISQEDERRDVIAYLKAIKDRPECD